MTKSLNGQILNLITPLNFALRKYDEKKERLWINLIIRINSKEEWSIFKTSIISFEYVVIFLNSKPYATLVIIIRDVRKDKATFRHQFAMM